MKKLICKHSGHKWRWFKTEPALRICKRCGKVHQQKWHMGGWIWSMPIEYTSIGAELHIINFDK